MHLSQTRVLVTQKIISYPCMSTESMNIKYLVSRVLQPLYKLRSLVHARVRIVKNELGGSATQQELRGWGLGQNGRNRGTGG